MYRSFLSIKVTGCERWTANVGVFWLGVGED